MASSNVRVPDDFDDDVPELEGWVSLPAAGEDLSATRQRLFQMKKEGKWKTIHKIRGAGGRPALYVVSTKEVAELVKTQRAAAGYDEQPDAEVAAR
jgi:hypothetical protein